MFIARIGERVEYGNDTELIKENQTNKWNKNGPCMDSNDNLSWSKSTINSDVCPCAPRIEWNILSYQITNILMIHVVSQNK